MIVVDTSALLAIVGDEPKAPLIEAALASAPILALSAGTLAEAMIVTGQRQLRPALDQLLTPPTEDLFPRGDVHKPLSTGI